LDTLLTELVARVEMLTRRVEALSTIELNGREAGLADDFDQYGRDQIVNQMHLGLSFLSVLKGDSLADSQLYGYGPDVVIDTAHYLQGAGAILYDAVNDFAYRELTPDLDFTSALQFQSTDFIACAVYCTTSATVRFLFEQVEYNSSQYSADCVAGWNYIAFKRSLATGSVNWVHINNIDLKTTALSGQAWIDDVRIVRADPNDTESFNDTGREWDFDGGIWHIYDDVPDVPYALGQIDVRSAGTRGVALKVAPTATNYFEAGVYAREDGAVGLLAFASDGDNGYEIKVDTAGNTLKLLRWIGGSSSELASVAYTSAPNTRYRLGMERTTDGYLKGHISSVGGPLFTAEHLWLYVADSTYTFGKLGVVSYGVNSRFFQVRAGAFARALVASYADEADTLDGLHASEI